MRILLVGYYGKANFGDDVLLKVTHGIVRQWRPDAEISVLCDQYLEDYLPELVGDQLRIVQPGNREHFDLIVHGGGGTFFDFNRYELIERVIHNTIRFVGFRNFANLDKIIRSLLGKQRFSAKKRLGWGIGVGTYSFGSIKLRHHVTTLLDFNALVVRDRISVKNLQQFGLAKNAVLGSDLAFLDNYWVPPSVSQTRRIKTYPPRLGVILRDWHVEPHKKYLELFHELLPSLSYQYNLSLFVLDERVDKQLLEMAAPYNTYVWSPPSTSISDFCSLLAGQDVIVSSRAHGALCGAVLGVPAVLIAIEEKLISIHEMLPHATRLVELSALGLSSLTVAIETLLGTDAAIIADDVAANKRLIKNAVDTTLLANE